jgi:endonuclease VIII
MAEGDTVHATAERLRERLEGRKVVRTDLRVPRYATVDLAGRVLRDVVARGKHLLMRTEDGWTIHSHLGMDGSWRLYADGERWRGPTFEIRAVIGIQGWSAVGHRLRRLAVLPTRDESEVVGHLGPDPLGPGWDETDALRRLIADPGRAVGDGLIDQTVVAGPGNVYRSEVCFLAGVDPRTPVADVLDPAAVVALTASLLQANRAGGRRVTTGDRRRGQELWVYGRAGEPCRRCATRIRRLEVGPPGAERVAYLCPSCQAPDCTDGGGQRTGGDRSVPARPVDRSSPQW